MSRIKLAVFHDEKSVRVKCRHMDEAVRRSLARDRGNGLCRTLVELAEKNKIIREFAEEEDAVRFVERIRQRVVQINAEPVKRDWNLPQFEVLESPNLVLGVMQDDCVVVVKVQWQDESLRCSRRGICHVIASTSDYSIQSIGHPEITSCVLYVNGAQREADGRSASKQCLSIDDANAIVAGIRACMAKLCEESEPAADDLPQWEIVE